MTHTAAAGTLCNRAAVGGAEHRCAAVGEIRLEAPPPKVPRPASIRVLGSASPLDPPHHHRRHAPTLDSRMRERERGRERERVVRLREGQGEGR